MIEQDKLVQDCLLKDEELEENIRKDYKDFKVRDETGYVQDLLIWTMEAQLAAAIPIIEKAERDRLLWKFEEYIRVWFGKSYLNPEDKDMAQDWQALRGDR